LLIRWKIQYKGLQLPQETTIKFTATDAK